MGLRDVVARNIKDFRGKAGLTQAEVFVRTKINPRHLSQIENGELNLTLDTVERLAAGLGVQPSDLLKDTAQAPYLGSKKELAGIDAAIRLLRGYKTRIEAK